MEELISTIISGIVSIVFLILFCELFKIGAIYLIVDRLFKYLKPIIKKYVFQMELTSEQIDEDLKEELGIMEATEMDRLEKKVHRLENKLHRKEKAAARRQRRNTNDTPDGECEGNVSPSENIDNESEQI